MVDAVPRHQDTTNLHTFARGGSKLFFYTRSFYDDEGIFLLCVQSTNYVFYCGLLFREENHTSGTTATLTYGQQQHFVIDVFFSLSLHSAGIFHSVAFPLFTVCGGICAGMVLRYSELS